MKQQPFQAKKLTLNKTTITLLGNTWYKGSRAVDMNLPFDLSTLPACNTVTSTSASTTVVY